MKSIYDLSWSEISFRAKLALFFRSRKEQAEKIRSNDSGLRAEGYTALSSTYYSIAGTAVASIKASRNNPLLIIAACFTWLPLGAWCWWRMLPLSNKAARGAELAASQCDVRQSILRRRGKYGEAILCIREGLSRSRIDTHTSALLAIGLADAYLHMKYTDRAQTWMNKALALAELFEDKDPHQAGRVYKQAAAVADHTCASYPKFAADLRVKALRLAESVGAKDQLVKMG